MGNGLALSPRIARRASEIDNIDFHQANSEVLKFFLSKHILIIKLT